jgi:intein/homing endonuclease
MLMSDGHIGLNGVGLTTADAEIAALFERLTFRLFGLSSAQKIERRASCIVQVEAHSRALSRWLVEAVGVSAEHDNNRVPDAILQAPPSALCAFVRGYTLDGYAAAKRGWAHICSTTSKTMACDLAAILWSLGFDAMLGSRSGQPFWFSDTNKGQGKDQYVVYLGRQDSLRFVEKIGFIEGRKNEIVQLANAGKVMRAHKSNSVWAEPFHDLTPSKVNGRRLRLAGERVSIETVRAFFAGQGFDHLLDPALRFTRVVEVGDGGAHHTYDLSVDTSHEYVANGVIVHNTLKYDPSVVDFETFSRTLLKWQPEVKCCSVMPQEDNSAHEYLPEQAVNKAQFEAVAAAISEVMAEDVGFEHVGCGTGGCPVDWDEGEK